VMPAAAIKQMWRRNKLIRLDSMRPMGDSRSTAQAGRLLSLRYFHWPGRDVLESVKNY
jgi:hypothetical protein